jgi:hypothetical protein
MSNKTFVYLKNKTKQKRYQGKTFLFLTEKCLRISGSSEASGHSDSEKRAREQNRWGLRSSQGVSGAEVQVWSGEVLRAPFLFFYLWPSVGWMCLNCHLPEAVWFTEMDFSPVSPLPLFTAAFVHTSRLTWLIQVDAHKSWVFWAKLMGSSADRWTGLPFWTCVVSCWATSLQSSTLDSQPSLALDPVSGHPEVGRMTLRKN